MITLDGNSIEDFGIRIMYDFEQAILPEMKTHFQEFSIGSLNYGTSLRNRVFSFKCAIDGKDIHSRVQEFKKIFFDKRGETKELKLIILLEKNKYFTVTLSEQIILKYSSEQQAEFSLVLTATDPLSQSIYETSFYFENVDGMATGGFSIPIEYYGTYPTEFNMSIFGDLSYFDIEEHKRGGEISIFHYISPPHSTYFKLDFSKFTIDDNGNNGLPNSTGEFIQIDLDTTKLVFKGDI
ncbi:MAG: hypothetical protein ACRCZG_07105, partial [Culicoidibacterales bacterium]